VPYLSLYRKYRPRNFVEIVGQRHVTQTLANAITAGRIAHAYLFCGPRGTGKTSTARVLAMALNCEKGPTSEPDSDCETCRRIIAGSALDVIEIDAASNRGIDEIRELRERVGLAAAEARTKVYIIDEVHMLTGEAFNAFLKTLEEPPSHVVFVLATTEPHRVLPTILSRCQRFDFHRIGIRDIEAAIRSIGKQESVVIDDSAVAMLAHAADGSFRDSLTLLDQAIAYAEGPVTAEVVSEILGGIDIDLVIEFTDVLVRRDIGGALALVDRVVSEGKDLRQLVDTLIGHYRNLLVLTVDRRGGEALALPEESAKRLAAQAKLLTTDEITGTLDLLAELDRELRFTGQPRLLVELAVVRVCRLAPSAKGAPARSERPHSAAAEPRPEAKAPEPAVADQVPAAPKPAAAPTEAEGREEADLSEIKHRWGDLLAELRTLRKSSPAPYLAEAVPVALDDNVLTIAFGSRFQFHYDQIAKDPTRIDATVDAISRLFGRTVTLKCTIDDEGGGERSRHPKRVQEALTTFPGSEVEE
jgi:DNA polymerase-3 subunit gamma/tau